MADRPRPLAAALATALGAALLTLPAAPAAAQYGGELGLIAFVDSGYGLSTMSPSGTGVRRVAFTSRTVDHPSWSADGSRLAYDSSDADSNRQIVLAAPDGTGARTLTSAPTNHLFPALSPDGATVAYARGNAELVVQPTDGTGSPVVLDSAPVNLGWPTWSPDGSTLTYSKNGDLYSVPAAGGTPTRLTSTPDEAETDPDYSPDGTTLAYERNGAVWAADPDGSDARRLTFPSQPFVYDLTWAPTGSGILYTGAVRSADDSPLRAVYLPGDGSRSMVIGTVEASSVAWQPTPSGGAPAPVAPADSVPPTIEYSGPGDGTQVEEGGRLQAAFTCYDDQLLVNSAAACTATVNGTPIEPYAVLPTSAPGDHALTMRAEDSAGNITTRTITYTVVGVAAEVTYTIDSGATLTYYSPTSNVPPSGLAVVGTESLYGHYTLKAKAGSQFSGAHEYDVTEMRLFTSSGRRFTLSSPGRMVCWAPQGCSPEVALSVTGWSGTTSVRIQSTGIAPHHIAEEGTPKDASGFNWVNPGNSYTGGGYGMYVTGNGLQITGSLKLHATRGVRDATGPTVTVTGVTDGQSVAMGTPLSLTYSCTDPSGVATCTGPVASGAALDTSAAGDFTATVTATDNYGNVSSRSVSYTVAQPADTVLPTAAVLSPADGAFLPSGSTVALQYACSDDVAVASCTAQVFDQEVTASIPNGGPLDTSRARDLHVTVVATDTSGNIGSTSRTFTVLAPGAAVQQVTGGETVSTGATATPATPVQTAVRVPVGVSGTLTVTPQTTTTETPSGFALFGKEVVLEGPPTTPTSPYQVSFTVDASVIAGLAPSDVQVFRNGVALTGCTSPTAAVPDPCIVSRGFTGDDSGDALVTVRTSQFSTWSLGRLKYSLTGPFSPVAASPTVNSAKAGSAIPVKFRLGGNRGLDVLSGTPTTASFTCSKGKTAEVGPTGSSTGSSLAYDTATGTYTYTWKTTAAMKGCRDLVLRFRDGSSLRTLYSLK